MLTDATAGDDRRFARAFSLLEGAIAARVFPGAVLAVAHRGRLLACRPFGHFTYDLASPAILGETLWDLASLTKPIATVSMAMLLAERGRLSLEAPIVAYLPEFAEPGPELPAASRETQRQWRQSVTVAMLLAHSSGLPAYAKLYRQATGPQAIQAAARLLPLEVPPGTRTAYSDVGFIVLGELLESLAAESLDRFCQREIFSPLNLHMSFTPQPAIRASIPPTASATEFRLRLIQGEVHDDNAAAMGGLAPHAGLFSDALSVARFAECLLSDGAPLFQAATVRRFTALEPTPPGTSRTLGWDTPSSPSQSGSLFAPGSFGHLGYTGTSLWCDPVRHLSVTLLTNRTWPDSANQAIKQLRPPLHDAIVSAIQNR